MFGISQFEFAQELSNPTFNYKELFHLNLIEILNQV